VLSEVTAKDIHYHQNIILTKIKEAGIFLEALFFLVLEFP